MKDYNSQEKSIEASFLGLCTATLEQCHKYHGNDLLPVVPFITKEFFNSNSERRIIRSEASIGILDQHSETLLKDQRVQECISKHETEVLPSHPGLSSRVENFPKELSSLILLRELYKPLFDCLVRYNNLSPSNDRLIESYREWRCEWEKPESDYTVCVPLINFINRVGDIELDEDIKGIRITEFSDSIKNKIWWSTQSPEFVIGSWMTLLEFSQCHYCLIFEANHERGTPRSWRDIQEKAENVLLALRLSKHGLVGIPVLLKWRKEERWDKNIYSYNTADLTAGQCRAIFELASQDTEVFKEVFKSIFSCRHKLKDLEPAMHRFNLGYTRNLSEDRVIDYIICLETCILRQSRGEYRYKLPLRSTRLLEAKKNPKDVFYGLKALYDLRSAIVHNGITLTEIPDKFKSIFNKMNTPPNFKRIDDFAEEMARCIVTEYIHKMVTGKTIDELNCELDEKAAGIEACPETDDV